MPDRDYPKESVNHMAHTYQPEGRNYDLNLGLWYVLPSYWTFELWAADVAVK